MSLSLNERKYNNYIKGGRILFIAGIGMLFESVENSIIVGILMIIIGTICIIYYNKQISLEKRKEIIIKFLEDNIIIINKKPKNKEIKIIDSFSKKYEYNDNIIDIKNLEKIINYDINYDNLTLFLDIYTFVKKYKFISNLKIVCNNKLLADYYYHYNNIIAFISYLDNIKDINVAINYMIEDYHNNAKILDNLMKEILINNELLNKKPSNPINIIKYISTVFNYILDKHLDDIYNS